MSKLEFPANISDGPGLPTFPISGISNGIKVGRFSLDVVPQADSLLETTAKWYDNSDSLFTLFETVEQLRPQPFQGMEAAVPARSKFPLITVPYPF